ncbi:hypothetical protein ACN27G_29400 [Plantactinospora sp. WMMB334]|uniref:hypothetical protein n=1 Tax=Plantactinospora sp. WMMB334 TaxID=3404119 RepID=UPI003B931316
MKLRSLVSLAVALIAVFILCAGGLGGFLGGGTAVGRLLRLNKPGSGEVDDADAADAPLCDRQRLVTAADLLPSAADSAVPASAAGGEHQP